jgi:hypothetical protein
LLSAVCEKTQAHPDPRIKTFYGTSANAVKTQIWIAVSVYLLVGCRTNSLIGGPFLAHGPATGSDASVNDSGRR